MLRLIRRYQPLFSLAVALLGSFLGGGLAFQLTLDVDVEMHGAPITVHWSAPVPAADPRPVARSTPEPSPPAPPPPGLGEWRPADVPLAFPARVFVLSDDFQWVAGSGLGELPPSIEQLGVELAEAAILEHLHAPGLQNRLRLASDVIAVGMASCEGPREDEGRRARNRAQKMVEWLRRAQPQRERLHDLRIWSLNLGRFRTPCEGASSDATRDQRRIAIVVLERHPDVELDPRALAAAMDRTPSLVFQPKHYFELELVDAS